MTTLRINFSDYLEDRVALVVGGFRSKPIYFDRNQYNLFRHNGSRLGAMTLFRFVVLLLYCCFTSTVNIYGHDVGTVS